MKQVSVGMVIHKVVDSVLPGWVNEKHSYLLPPSFDFQKGCFSILRSQYFVLIKFSFVKHSLRCFYQIDKIALRGLPDCPWIRDWNLLLFE